MLKTKLRSIFTAASNSLMGDYEEGKDRNFSELYSDNTLMPQVVASYLEIVTLFFVTIVGFSFHPLKRMFRQAMNFPDTLNLAG